MIMLASTLLGRDGECVGNEAQEEAWEGELLCKDAHDKAHMDAHEVACKAACDEQPQTE